MQIENSCRAKGSLHRPQSEAGKAQSAMEYLVTYSWALLILVLVLAALIGFGLFNQATYTPNACAIQGDFSCRNTTLYSAGNFAFTLGQSVSSPITITAIGCNTTVSTNGVKTYNVFLPIGNNMTTYVQCYSGNVPFSGKLGAIYTGYLTITYININTGFSQTVTGSITQKVASTVLHP